MATMLEHSPIPLTENDAISAQETSRVLSRFLNDAPVRFRLTSSTDAADEVSLSAANLQQIVELLDQIGTGNAVQILPVTREMTPQQAAKLVGMSRPFFVRLLDNGTIPFRYVGAHRRIRVADVLTYKREIARREAILDELVGEAQELDMGY